MNILQTPRWALPESMVTPEHVFLNRRKFIAAMGAAGAGMLIDGRITGASAATPEQPYAPKPLRSQRYADAGREQTPEEDAATYNNFYEFGSHKRIHELAQKLQTDGWSIEIDGKVEQPLRLSMDDLLRRVSVEERIYRHRCVEAWSMVVPWIGFPVRDLVEIARPLSSAKFLRFETFQDPDTAPGQKQFWYPWPYVEGISIEEAANDLSFLVTGAYGKVLHKQFGAPIRLHLPWKYGFKSIKSIVRVSFEEEQPVSFWERLADKEYGFWANVNPEVDHPRWSQANEKDIGTGKRIPTVIYNGYGEEVASLYSQMENSLQDRLWR